MEVLVIIPILIFGLFMSLVQCLDDFNRNADVILPYSTVEFLISSGSKRVDCSWDSITVIPYNQLKKIKVGLSFSDLLKYRILYNKLEEEKTKRAEVKGLEAVISVLKTEKENLSHLAEEEFKQAEAILKEAKENLK